VKGMQILHRINLLAYLKNNYLDLCEHCVYEKQKRDIFLRVRKEKKSERLELVHKYVWGPTQVSSLGGSHCYVTFIDDATRKKWVYFILLSHIIVWGVFSFGFGPWVTICTN